MNKLPLNFARLISPKWHSTSVRLINPTFKFEQFAKYSFQSSEFERKTMFLPEVVKQLESFSPKSLAESWDNVGLLVEPTHPHEVHRVLLCIDLTEAVFEEAHGNNCNLILSYHPVIFSPLKKLCQSSWKERIIAKCLENRIAVYCPHTCYDTMHMGITDWLISPFVGNTQPITMLSKVINSDDQRFKVECAFTAAPEQLEKYRQEFQTRLTNMKGVNWINFSRNDPSKLIIDCAEDSICALTKILGQLPNSSLQITKLHLPPSSNQGAGRRCELNDPIDLETAINLIKKHLQLSYVRLAKPRASTMASKINSVAVCAGSGASVLAGVKADLYLTGEMSHHAVLDATQRGTAVVLCEHTNTERGYLPTLKNYLTDRLDGVNILISKCDSDPLVTM